MGKTRYILAGSLIDGSGAKARRNVYLAVENGIITDIGSRTSETIKSLYNRPTKVLIEMWQDLQYENWIDRGQQVEQKTKDEKMKEYEQLKREAGV